MDSALIARLYSRLFPRKSIPSSPTPQRYKRTLRSRHKPQFSFSNSASPSPPVHSKPRNSPSFPHSISPPRREERILDLEARILEKEERFRKIQARYRLLLVQSAPEVMISPTKLLIRGILRELRDLQSSAEAVERQLRLAEGRSSEIKG